MIGALAVVVSGILVENYKRHRDRQGVASALAGEIALIIEMTKARNYLSGSGKSRLRSRRGPKIPSLIPEPVKLDPVIEKHLDRIGVLGPHLPEGLASFYARLGGIRHDLVNLSAGRWDQDRGRKAGLIREDLRVWEQTEALGLTLIADLRAVASEEWWLWTACRKCRDSLSRRWGALFR